MHNKIDDLRNHLFATLEALQDPDKPMDLDRARAVADVAKVLVDSVKVEVEMIKVVGASVGTGFLPIVSDQPPPPRALSATAGGGTAPLHICRGCKHQTKVDPCEHCGARWRRIA